jgi:hypothetical protein
MDDCMNEKKQIYKAGTKNDSGFELLTPPVPPLSPKGRRGGVLIISSISFSSPA